jgi:N-acyl-D-amino-acid deacylase
VPLLGHNTVRGAVIGYDDVQPTPEQQAEMERVVEEAMEQGARGISTGLYYPPGYYAKTEEVIGLARAAARHGGIYASHVRSESDLVLEAVAEAIEIGEKANIQVEIAHLKLESYRNWHNIDRLVALLDDTQARGLRVGCDQYPYIACSTWLAAMLPYWAQAGGSKAVAERLRDPEVRVELRRDWEENRAEWDNRTGIRNWTDLVVSDCPNRPNLVGKSIYEIAEAEGKDPLEAAFGLIVISEGLAACVWFTQREENVQTLMRHPLVVVGSDGSSLKPEGVLGQSKVHPRSYGTFPRVLGHYVREERVLSLEEAVKKMTSIAADRFGLTDRGVIREGAWADLVLFDADTVIDKATFTEPHQYPVGIPYVVVNGQVVIDQDVYTGALPGRVL